MKYFAVSMIAALLAACGQPPVQPAEQRDTSAAPMAQAHVSLEIFSGRPAPTWTLSEANTQTLLAMLAELPSTDQAMPEGQLGYRGFIVTVPQATTTLTSTLTVYRTLIMDDSNGTSRLLLDSERHVEQFLITSAKDYLDAATYAALVSQAEEP